MASKNRFPIYPFFLLVYFYLHLYEANLDKGIHFAQVLLPFGISLAIVCVLWVILWLVFRNSHRAALFLTAMVFVFFSFGHLHTALSRFLPVPAQALLVLSGLLLAAIGLTLFIRRPEAGRWSGSMNLIIGILMLMPLITILPSLRHRPVDGLGEEKVITSEEAFRAATRAGYPDIYYIILDEYASSRVLKAVHGFDNSPFEKALESIGFMIMRDSFCNYLRTKLSMASSLNMTYLDFISQNREMQAGQVGKKTEDLAVIFSMVRGNNVARILKSIGYKYILADSGASPTHESPLADQEITYMTVDELTSVIARGTMLGKAATDLLNAEQRKRHHYTFEALKKIPEIEGPTFTFAHMILPHPPFVFNRNGEPPSTEAYSLITQDYGGTYPELYLDQLLYTNKLILDLVEEILKKSDRPPIIIIHADHGLMPHMRWDDSEEFLLQRGWIFTALFFPGPQREKLYSHISPVNFMRFVFKEYFKAPMELLPDRIFYAHPDENPYDFKDVTPLFEARFLNKAAEKGDGDEVPEPAKG